MVVLTYVLPVPEYIGITLLAAGILLSSIMLRGHKEIKLAMKDQGIEARGSIWSFTKPRTFTFKKKMKGSLYHQLLAQLQFFQCLLWVGNRSNHPPITNQNNLPAL